MFFNLFIIIIIIHPRDHHANTSRAQRKGHKITTKSTYLGNEPGLGAIAGVGHRGAAGLLKAHFGVYKMGGYDL